MRDLQSKSRTCDLSQEDDCFLPLDERLILVILVDIYDGAVTKDNIYIYVNILYQTQMQTTNISNLNTLIH